MAVIVLPETPVKWRASSWGLDRADNVQRYVNGGRQVTSYPRALWSGSITLPPLFDDDEARRLWRSRLTQLCELGNVFEMSPPDAQSGPSTGYAGPAPVVAGADQLGASLDVDGLTPSAAILREGEYFHIVAGGVKELKMLTADVTADGDGEATMQFKPVLRNAPADDSVVEISAPRCTFAMTTPRARWQNAIDGYSEFTLEFEEAFGN